MEKVDLSRRRNARMWDAKNNGMKIPKSARDPKKKCIFWGEKGHDPEQSKDLESKKRRRRSGKSEHNSKDPWFRSAAPRGFSSEATAFLDLRTAFLETSV